MRAARGRLNTPFRTRVPMRRLPRVPGTRVGRIIISGVLAALASACGEATPTKMNLGGASNFLRQCGESCESRLDCINGLCTQACFLDEANSCATLPTAACTSKSTRTGAITVCDVPCSSNDGCSALGSDYLCQGGYCRGPELPSGAGNMGGNGADASAEGVGCSTYRDQPGQTEIAIVIRNERNTPLYVQPFRDCDDPASSRVGFERDGLPVNVRGIGVCGSRTCEDIQDNGSRAPEPCPAACQPAPALLRVEPGAELDGGRLWREFVSHGGLASSERMPNACYSGYMDPQLLPGIECFAERPLPAGNYRVTARAFTSPMGVGETVLASTTLEVPTPSAVLTFVP